MGRHTGTGLKWADVVVEDLKGEVKDEMPSLPLVHSELKTLERTYLLHT